jgi:hypothetical protein
MIMSRLFSFTSNVLRSNVMVDYGGRKQHAGEGSYLGSLFPHLHMFSHRVF